MGMLESPDWLGQRSLRFPHSLLANGPANGGLRLAGPVPALGGPTSSHCSRSRSVPLDAIGCCRGIPPAPVGPSCRQSERGPASCRISCLLIGRDPEGPRRPHPPGPDRPTGVNGRR
ncbi:hypothetical protein chiPu_0026719 [Chiloscyllium punctatum]|uniref:Uncharacterized protein n=1 Tax=Chiloscyllium punctatum TaxID=137246 RepID=A0A401TJD4_CHIPU|nr:hypothetical protein [Chiloscyllium punctatum]